MVVEAYETVYSYAEPVNSIAYIGCSVHPTLTCHLQASNPRALVSPLHNNTILTQFII